MKVILLRDVAGVGQKGAVITVSDGYALNFLIPKKIAVMATPEKLASHEKVRKEKESEAAARSNTWVEYAKRLQGASVTIRQPANEHGQLYGQVATGTIADRITRELGVSIPTEAITTAPPIKSLGRSEAVIRLGDRKVPITVFVEREH